MCKSVSIAVYSSVVKSFIFSPAVGYTSDVFGTSIHTYWFPLLSCIVNPFSNVVPSTCVNPSGKYVPPVVFGFWLVTVVAPPFISSPGCFGSASTFIPISVDKFSFVSSIGVFSNFTFTVIVVSSPAFNVVFSRLHCTSKYSSFVLVAFAVKSADKSVLWFFTVYVAIAVCPLAFNPDTFIVPCVLSAVFIVAVVVPSPLVCGSPINSTLKLSGFPSDFAVPSIFNPTFVIAAYPTATSKIATNSIPPIILLFVLLILLFSSFLNIFFIILHFLWIIFL